tara:strand:+ start:5115 stop:5855 length:741 start_codon:yes stop_codon:yes gene_type:complete
MVKLPIYFISDCHFSLNMTNVERKNREKLFSLFKSIKSSGGTLVLGGDFFDFWFQYKYVIPKNYIEIIESLKALTDSGISIHYVLGNHDYWDFGYFNDYININTYKNDFNLKFLNHNIKITHGDGLLKNDYGYRFLKKIIRSKLFIYLFKNFHPDWGCALASKISRSSSHYNHHDNKSQLIHKEIKNYAIKKWDEGFNTVLVGHYHQIGIEKEGKNKLIFMGDWLRHHTVTRLSEDGWDQLKYNEI